MKLWLDDKTDGTRPKPDETWIHLTTAKEVIDALKTGEVDEISLDHDLGEKAIVGDGGIVARWIENAAFNGDIPKLIWHIHSKNPIGSEEMRKALENADYLWGIDQEEEDRI